MRRSVLVFAVVSLLAAAPVIVNVHAGWHIVPGRLGCDIMRSKSERSRCTANILFNEASVLSARAFLRYFQNEGSAHEDRTGLCHQTLHRVGRRIARDKRLSERFGSSMLRDLTEETNGCTAGVEHGYQEQLYEALKNHDASTVKTFAAMCNGAETMGAYDSCAHGLGHGFDRIDGLAFRTRCRDAFLSRIATAACLNGGYMQEKAARVEKGVTKAPPDFCLKNAEGFLETSGCVGYHGGESATRPAGDMHELCPELPGEALRQDCLAKTRRCERKPTRRRRLECVFSARLGGLMASLASK